MKATITYQGELVVKAETDLEGYALKRWKKDPKNNYHDTEIALVVLVDRFEIHGDFPFPGELDAEDYAAQISSIEATQKRIREQTETDTDTDTDKETH
jgi:hypothetical protein